MSTPFRRVEIIPNYMEGFTFTWILNGSFVEAKPWVFTVEEAPAPDGPWEPISPALTDTYMWQEDERRVVNKTNTLWFRISVTTPINTQVSAPISPYGDLERRDFLLVADIIRREILAMREMEGVPGQVWLVNTKGTPCTECLDPVTKQPTSSMCDTCQGTGRNPGYYGPYAVWLTFSVKKLITRYAKDGTGVRQPRQHAVRMVGAPQVKFGDVVVDTAQDKRYFVHAVNEGIAIRRVPAVQMLDAREAPVTDQIYKLGE